MQAVLLVGAGGALGAVARYGTGVLFGRLGLGGFPWTTMTVNILGSFLMGLFISYLAFATPPHQAELRQLIAIGVMGGFTTFSSFSLDAMTMIERGQFMPAAFYILASVVVSIVALFIGMLIFRGMTA